MTDWRVKCLVIPRMSAVTQSSRWQHPFVLSESSTPLTIRSSALYCTGAFRDWHQLWFILRGIVHFRVNCFLNSTPIGCYVIHGPYNYWSWLNCCYVANGPCNFLLYKARWPKVMIWIHRTVLKQTNHNCPESAERIIRRNNRSQTSTTISGYSRFELPPTLKWRHCQSMDQIWHATCGCLLSLFCEHQVH